MNKKVQYVTVVVCFYLRRSRAGLGLLRDVLVVVVVVVVVVVLVDIFVLLSRRPPTKIFIKTKL